MKTGCYTQQWTKIPKASIYHPASHANYLGIFARNVIATQSFHSGEYFSKCQITKEKTS